MHNYNSHPTGDEDEPIVLISSLQHYTFCPRQCALIILEDTFTENILTLSGRLLHTPVHQSPILSTDLSSPLRSFPLYSDTLRLIGKADLIEFHNSIPYPIEYKHGKKKQFENLDIQLCAQALCLEEMFQCHIPRGAIFHISSHRRREVDLTPQLRSQTIQTIQHVRSLIRSQTLPPPLNDPHCPLCSLINDCMPETTSNLHSINSYITSLFTTEENHA